MRSPLFTNDAATDPAYLAVRDGTDPVLQSTRARCEYLWIFYQSHADKEFRTELRRTFNARYWEMYLTTSLILSGFEVTCPKPGPDVGIMYRGQRIWFEAVAPDCGDPAKPDSVPTEVNGPVPQERILLRYLNSISTKQTEQYSKWLASGAVSSEDALVYAINPRNIPWDWTDSDPPRLLQAGYTVGPPNVTIDRESMKVIARGYEFRGLIEKTPKAAGETGGKVPTGIFQQPGYASISGLLCSRVDAANGGGEMGADFQLAPNLHASRPLPGGFRLQGTYHATTQTLAGYTVSPTPVQRATLF